MLTIDQEESKTDESKSSSAANNNQKNNQSETSKLSTLQQKLLEGIEKTKVGSIIQDIFGFKNFGV